MSTQNKSLKKRQQIDAAHRNMFLAVAISAFLTGFAIVAAIFMFNKMSFNNRVIGEKTKTHQTLLRNNKNLEHLATEIKSLQTNDNLRAVSLGNNDNLKAILDALPAIGNSTALGASLKDKILTVPGVIIENISVESIASEVDEATVASSNEDSTNQINFSFKVSGRAGNLSQVLKNMERSIRPMVVDNVRFEVSTNENQSILNVSGHSFYEPMLEAKLFNRIIRSRR